MKLVETILENMTISFSGRINVLSEQTKQFIGSIVLSDGILVDANFGQSDGKKALANLLMESKSNSDISIISEPELLSENDFSFYMEEQAFFKFKNDYFEQHDLLRKLRPSKNLVLSLNCKKLDIYTPLSFAEFDAMKLILLNGSVGEVYNNSKMLEFDVTKSLISLRKKGIILVKGHA
jgi:hypothetical protein